MKAITTLERWVYSKGSIHALIPVVLGNLAALALSLRAANLATT